MAIPEESPLPPLPDYQQAGQNMEALNLKMPPRYKRQLEQLAQKMNTKPTTLGRHLLIRGMADLAA